jgi:protein-S-isoprenylcysteine O-methyltransferase Ste14
MIIIPLLYVATPWLGFADYHLPAWTGLLGAAVLAGSLWLFWRSHVELGDNWYLSLRVREGHSLVTEGVFRHIRHPMYASQWLWGLAQALLLQNWIAGLSGLAGLLPMYLFRVPREEQMMLDHFGDAYTRYMNRTGRIIPRSWMSSGGKSAGGRSAKPPGPE